MRLGVFGGRIGRDAELRHTKSGKPVAGFSLAVDIHEGGEKRTQWVDCSLWGDRAEKLAPHLTKGTSVTVSGDVATRVYEHQNEHKAQLTCTVYNITLQGSREKTEAPAQRGIEDDIPF